MSSTPKKKTTRAPPPDWTDDLLDQCLDDSDEYALPVEVSRYADASRRLPKRPLAAGSNSVDETKGDADAPPTPPIEMEDPNVVLRRKKLATGELSSALNEIFAEWLDTNADAKRVLQYAPYLELRKYDDTEFDLKPPALYVEGAGEDGVHAVVFTDRANTFSRCIVLSYDEATELYTVQDVGTTEISKKYRVELCFAAEDRFTYIKRLTACLLRRTNAEALIKYHYIVNQMPVESHGRRDDLPGGLVTSSMLPENSSRILGMALAQIERKQDPLTAQEAMGSDTVVGLLQEAVVEYEGVMNRVVFDMNMLNAANLGAFLDLSLPSIPKPPPVPQIAVVAGCPPRSSYDETREYFLNLTMCTSVEVINSLVNAAANCIKVEDTRVLACSHNHSMTLQKFQEMENRTLMKALRHLKDEWPQRTAAAVRSALADVDREVFNAEEGILKLYMAEDNKMRKLMARMNYTMSDTLYDITAESIKDYSAYVLECCNAKVTVEGTNNIKVILPPGKNPMTPPLIATALQRSAEKHLLNQDEISKTMEEIRAWRASEEGKKEGALCPIAETEPVYGHIFEYSAPLDDFDNVIVGVFDACISELQGIPQVQKYVMERIFWAQPARIASVNESEEFVKDLRAAMSKAVNAAKEPLQAYMEKYQRWADILNLNVEEYLKTLTHVKVDEENSKEGEEPLYKVDLDVFRATLDSHAKQKHEILTEIPEEPIDCGLFSIDPTEIRELLSNIHKEIIDCLLDAHMDHAMRISLLIQDKFAEVLASLSVNPANIEEVAALKETMDGVKNVTGPLEEKLAEMQDYFTVHDDFKFKISAEANEQKWTAIGWPKKVAEQIEEAQKLCDQCVERYHQEMLNEQEQFLVELDSLEKEIAALDQFTDFAHVTEAARRCKEASVKLVECTEKAQLFNSREGLFDTDSTDYDQLSRMKKTFEPFNNLWGTASSWSNSSKTWLSGDWFALDGEQVEAQTDEFAVTISKAAKFFDRFEAYGAQANVARQIKDEVDKFKPKVPLVLALRNQGMRERHWEQLSDQVGFKISPTIPNPEETPEGEPPLEPLPNPDFNLQKCLDLNLLEFVDQCTKVSEQAAREFTIEQTLNGMESAWDDMELDIFPYRDTGTGVLKGVDEIMAILDEQVTLTQAMMFSAFKGPFEQRIDDWNHKLFIVSEVLESWLEVQRNWMYLSPIFESPDINKQLPAEGKKFANVDKNWKQTISATKHNKKIISFCANEKLLEKFKTSAILLDQVQKGLNEYLETKRGVFARFYFLSNDDLLSILSESKDVLLVQPHLKKCFEAINAVKFENDLTITQMISPEKEVVEFSELVDPNGKSVEVWMLEVEAMMLTSMHDQMRMAIEDYSTKPRTEWMQIWPSMCVLNGSQFHWTKETEEFFVNDGEQGSQNAYEKQRLQILDMVMLVQSGTLSKPNKTKVGALCVVDVHARDVMLKLAKEKVCVKTDFGWASQLRYYYDDDWLMAEMVAARRPYGYEYLGNSFRLVITPLTDKCYLTLMGALQMKLGGAPAGPAGTGKTETTKDLAKALAMQCVVFNCSDGLDFQAMGKFFKGLASCGAWACFDEFNRINIEVLSVIGQQISSIQLAIAAEQERMIFEGSDIRLKKGFGVFITMNPGYAGRSALPDSLQALFRPVAMMVPDYALIGEIMFIAFGFVNAKKCGAKMVTTFRLCSEQCSLQPHYDYGMRAVKTVITAAGNLKSAEPEADEMVLLLRALMDVNNPKFLAPDLPLFKGIISDLFPGLQKPELDYGDLNAVMKIVIEKHGLQPHPWFVMKVIQLYEMIVVRHGLMLVGPTGGGKSSNLHVLRDTLTELKERGLSNNEFMQKVIIYQLNPKSITMGQMYGAFDENTREWQDGIMSTMYRKASSSTTPERKWVMFNGPVDAIWIENMNTVLDDNKKLCLVSGETIKMSNEQTMMFEVEDLSVASPATVSRVGIIYMEPEALGIEVLVRSWLERLPTCFTSEMKAKLLLYYEQYMTPGLGFLRTFLKEQVPTVNNNLVQSLQRILDCYFEPYHEVEGREPMTKTEIKAMGDSLESLFIFSFIWSICATVDHAGRDRFSSMIRVEMLANGVKKPFPRKGDVYDYVWDMEKMGWKTWMETTDDYVVDSKLSFAELVVPTTDSVRNTYLLDLLLMKNNHILMVGETGTGKTVNIAQYLSGASKSCGKPIGSHIMPYTMTFSAQTSANMTQDMLDSRLDKRKRGVFGPPAGKKLAVYVDDLNMPKRETYGAQPPIEILRQWFDQAGWYDRAGMLDLRNIVDLLFIGSMGPPGGGRQDVTPRFLRHFNIIGYVEMSNQSKATIFETILQDFLKDFPSEIQSLRDPLTETTIEVFDYVVANLLPTPLKSHYMFNLRDLAKVFQGLLMGSTKFLFKKAEFLQLWVHEAQRVFEDRMVTKEDHEMFEELLGNQLQKHFNMDWEKVIGDHGQVVFGDYMNADTDVENRIYTMISDKSQLKTVVEDYLADHNTNSKQPMPLVMFTDAIMHVSTIARVLRQPGGNALLLGVGGSGRQSLTRLASYMMQYTVFQVTIQKGYGMTEWRDDLRKVLLMAGVKNKPVTFLFSDVQIIDETMVEDINNILNSADVPNIYGAEEQDQIQTACRSECTKKRLPPTKMNVFNQYIIRVKKNLHVVICMSPLGDVFRARLLNFPSLVNCCTIDWFTEWPAEALTSVGGAAMSSSDLGLNDLFDPVVAMFSKIHLTVQAKSKEFYERLRRRVYVTPTSYLELLSSFKSLLNMKREENNLKRKRLQIGLDKLASTKDVVSTLSAELEELMPKLVVKAKEVGEMMVDIKAQKAEAEKIKAAVEIDEAKASKMAEETQAIADSAQADLDEALPALAAATKCLDALSPADITEIKQFTKVGVGVEMTMKVVCFYFNVKPEIDKVDGKKVENYHKASKGGLINDPKKFITMLKDYDKDNIPDKTIKKVAPFMEGDEFLPEKIRFASVACEAVCMWARAMYKYHFVALGVEPKRIALAEAKAKLEVVMSQLAVAQAKLKDVVDNLDRLEAEFNGAVEEKAGLEAKEKKCKVQLSNADKLIGGLGGEEKRWKETVAALTEGYTNLLGDVLLSAGAVSYLGPFTADFRTDINTILQENLVEFNIPHTAGADMQSTLVDPVKQRQWQLCSLPSDSLSTQNAIMMDKSRRWSLLVDPQGQANRYIKSMGKDKSFSANGIDTTKLSDKNFLRTLENGIRLGKWVVLENIAEELDAALEPILLQQKFKQSGQDHIKIGDNNVPYDDGFRFFMTTKLPNPHYPPEIQVKVTLINFTVTPAGLEEQLLTTVVEVEMPDLAEKKGELVVANAAMNKQLFDIETDILSNLANAEGNILDNTELIETLAQAKATSEEVKAKMTEAEATTQEIILTSEQYRPVAIRATILYFCIAELCNVDPMYQYALPWFKDLFISGVEMAPQASEINERVHNINEFFTYKLYCNICRSLFERHKLLFSFLTCIKILQGDGKIDAAEYRFLISGISSDTADLPNPTGADGWVTKGTWSGICSMAGIHALQKVPQLFEKNLSKWKKVFDSLNPQTQEFPEPFDDLSPLQRMCIIRCLRQDKSMDTMQKFVIDYMGQKYVEPPPFDLKACYEDSGPVTPLVFVLSTGSDPFADLKLLAEELGFMDTLRAIALGQGQGPIAEAYMNEGMENGGWVLLQNCHLYVSWMPTLEKYAEDFDPARVHQDFRLWLTSMPAKTFPVGVLQMSVKMTKEPPAGIRAQLKQTYIKMNDASLMKTSKPAIFRKMLFGLNLFHALVVERKKYGALGWNIPYTFNETDQVICQAQLEMYVDLYDEVPYTVLQMLTSLVNYGGRITDDKDMRTADIIVASCLQPSTLEVGHRFSSSGLYKTIEADPDAPHKSYMDYIESLPLNAKPEIFGMHENASITSAINEAESNFQIILSLQPRTTGGGGASREDIIGDLAEDLEKKLRDPWDEEQVKLIYPTDYNECLNTTLTQEVEKFNRLIRVMHSTLKTLQLALKGLVVLSIELDAMGTSLYDQNVPALWTAKAPISLKRLGPWYSDLQQRLKFIGDWIEYKAPPAFWISGFFFPQGFMTACLQNYARKYTYPIDTISNGFIFKDEEVDDIKVKPEDGCFIYGLFSEGARWDKKKKSIVDPRPKELFTKMPIIHLTPCQHRDKTMEGIYRCPVYKVLSRTGTLSTTGHSTNFVFWLEVPSNKPTIFRATLVSETNESGQYCDNDYWVKGGVACFCALRD